MQKSHPHGGAGPIAGLRGAPRIALSPGSSSRQRYAITGLDRGTVSGQRVKMVSK